VPRGKILVTSEFFRELDVRPPKHNRKSKTINPALNNAGLHRSEVLGNLPLGFTELFSGLFSVAASRLNSPRFHRCLYDVWNWPVKGAPAKVAP